jgi:heat shock protein beta
MKRNLGDKVAKVQISKRISSSPCVLVSGKFGWSANMERIMKAQTLGDTSHMDFMRGQRILEINPNHPIVQDLKHTSKSNPQSAQSKQMLDLLYETALLSSGYTVSWILILLCQFIFSLFNININLGQYCWSLISV